MPSDITGYELLAREGHDESPKMVFRPGPVFANLVLADEINRAVPKTQSALLEAMAERHVTVGGRPTGSTSRSWSSPPRTRSSRRGLIPCPRCSSTAS